MATVQDIIDQLNRLAPFDIAESWDNSGLQAGDPAWEADKILIALDVTSAVMQEAVATGSNLVLTHHPLMMTPEKSIDFSTPAGYAIATCARHKISIVSAHTNLDKATAGLNDYFASKIGLTRLVGPLSRGSAGSDPEHDPGIGRLAVPDTPITLEQLIHNLPGFEIPESIRSHGSYSSKNRHLHRQRRLSDARFFIMRCRCLCHRRC